MAGQRRRDRQIAVTLVKIQFDFIPELDGDFFQVLSGGFTERINRKVACQPGADGSGGQNQEAEGKDQSGFQGVEGSDICYPGSDEWSYPSAPDVIQAVPGLCYQV
ncbi:MAG: hypothetical protein R3193_19290 [Marinobacter sp.]|nr:hypothetical protein [Marinobacter sp.]